MYLTQAKDLLTIPVLHPQQPCFPTRSDIDLVRKAGEECASRHGEFQTSGPPDRYINPINMSNFFPASTLSSNPTDHTVI
jgi:hypothetical protein